MQTHTSKYPRNLFTLAALLMTLVIQAGVHAQTTWYVDADNCPGPGAGSVSDPYCTIAQGIATATNGDTVEIADGVYLGSGNTDLNFLGKLITIRSSNGPDSCVIDCQGSESEPHSAFDFVSGENESAVLEGLTIRNAWYPGNGGAIRCEMSNPVIRHCRFLDNTAKSSGADWSGWGGAIFSRESQPLIEHCRFVGNRSITLGMVHSGYGGAIGSRYSEPVLKQCEFFDNQSMRLDGATAGGSGGAVGVFENYPIIIDQCLFVGNRADGGGGALIGLSAQEIHLINSLFVDNHAGNYGGAIWTRYTVTRFAGSTFLGNTATGGGAVRSLAPALSSGSWIAGCLLAGNIGYGGTGALLQSAGDPDRPLFVANTTVAHNWGTMAAIRNSDEYGDPGDSHLFVDNSVVTSNTPDQVSSDPDASTYVNYSDVEGGWIGEGNISSDPLFEPLASGNWTTDAAYSSDAWTTMFHDTNATWEADGLVGRIVRPIASPDPEVADEHRVSLIVANTSTSLTAWGNFESTGQTGAGYEILDYRLASDSPCIDAGDNAALPPDHLDLDSDGDVVESMPVDLDGAPRFMDVDAVADSGSGDPPLTDMGAFEAPGEAVRAIGCRYVQVIPGAHTLQTSSVHIASPDYPCLDKFLGSDGRLVDTPLFQSPGAWATVHMHGEEIWPETSYEIRFDDGSPQADPIEVSTWKWGDANNSGVTNLEDVFLVVQAFQFNYSNVTLYAADLVDCVPDGIVNFADIFAAVGAFQSVSFEASNCQPPC